jgi:putative nucleotidyltransferase with HDIG domain
MTYMKQKIYINKQILNSDQYRAARRASKLLQAEGFEVYVIGGAVRDIYLGIDPKDYDLVTNAKPDQISQISEFARSKYKDTAQAYGVSRVSILINRSKNEYVEIEIATYRKDIEAHLGRKLTKVQFSHLEDDVIRRDFTINALALDLTDNTILDLVEGIADLERKTLRFIGKPDARIKEDPLRILRAIRLKNELNFAYESNTRKAIIDTVKKDTVSTIVVERLRDELTRMIVSKSRSKILKDMLELKLLNKILPEVHNMVDTEQPVSLHYEGDVWKHTLLALDSLPIAPGKRLAWATLLHDVGKPATQTFPKSDKDRIRFSEHYSVGAQMAQEILTRLKFSNRDTEEIAWMVHHHLAIDAVFKMRPGRRQHMFSHPAFLDLIVLHEADARATWHLNKQGQIIKPKPDFRRIKDLYSEYEKKRSNPLPSLKSDLGIDGFWLKQNFAIENGPMLGELLHEMNEAYLDGKLRSTSSAKTFVLNKLNSKN